MKILRLVPWVMLGLGSLARGDEPSDSAQTSLDRMIDTFNRKMDFTPRASRPPTIDAKRIINQSSSFLREREPEMTTEEFALHEKIVTMLSTNPELAVKLLEAMMDEKERPSPAFEFILGNAYYAINQTERAEQRYRGAVERFPSFLRAWNNLGVLYHTSGRFADAAECFSKSVALGDRDSMTLGLLGYSLERTQNPLAAEQAYMQALAVAPGNGDWKEGLLRIYLDGRQYGRAEPILRGLIREKPSEARYWQSYAGMLVADRRKIDAMAMLEAADAVGAAGPDEWTLLGDLYAEQNLARDALAAYGKVLSPERARGEQKLLQLARIQIASGQLTEAEQTIAALKGEPTPTARLAILQTRAELLFARQRWSDARHEIETLLAINPLEGRALLTLGRIFLAEENLPRATFAFEAAERIPDTAYQANVELANVELKSRHFSQAIRHLEQALRLQKSDTVQNYLGHIRILALAEGGSE